MTYTEAINKFVETIKVNSLEYYKKTGLTHLVEKPEDVKINKGRRFDKIVKDTSVYCFVEKDTGFIFKPASWKAPQLKTKKPVRGSIYDSDTYKQAGPHGGWLYQ